MEAVIKVEIIRMGLIIHIVQDISRIIIECECNVREL
jgi:hypothetical protein